MARRPLFAADMLAERFGAQVVTTAGAIARAHDNVYARGVLRDVRWPGQIPPSPVTAVTVPGNRLPLEGHHLGIVEVGQAQGDRRAVRSPARRTEGGRPAAVLDGDGAGRGAGGAARAAPQRERHPGA